MNETARPFVRIVRGAAIAVCPRADRPWIEAMFAEASAIPERSRLAWLSGATSIVWAAFHARLGASLPAGRRWGAFGAAHVGAGFLGLGLTDIEAFIFDDDWFLAFGGITVTALAATLGAALVSAFRGPGSRQNAA